MNEETTYRVRYNLRNKPWVQYGGDDYFAAVEEIVPIVEAILTEDHDAQITIWPKEGDDEPPW